MANSPIQVVLNSNAFVQALENQGRGSSKDFYAGNDIEFIEHRDNLQGQLSTIKSMQLVNSFTKVSYARVTLNQSALAKSHRPTSQIFKKDIAPIVGAGDLGDLYVELSPESIDKIYNRVKQVETETRYKERDGKKEPNPSKLRSEIGAIQKILPYTASDKRKFSVKDAISWLSIPKTGGSYIVELFEAPPPRQNWDLLSKLKFDLFDSFFDGLEKIGNGLVFSKITYGTGAANVYGIRLEKSSNSTIKHLSPSTFSGKKTAERNEVDLDQTKHNSLLNFLENHPLVK